MLHGSWVSVLATALDPRFRQLKFLTDEQKTVVKAELLKNAEEFFLSVPSQLASEKNQVKVNCYQLELGK